MGELSDREWIRKIGNEIDERLGRNQGHIFTGTKYDEDSTPREEFEREFGSIEDIQWDWLKEFCRKYNGFAQSDPPQWNYNEYTQRDEDGNWWVIGLPGGPRKLDVQDDPETAWIHLCGPAGQDTTIMGGWRCDRCGVERSQARANSDN